MQCDCDCIANYHFDYRGYSAHRDYRGYSAHRLELEIPGSISVSDDTFTSKQVFNGLLCDRGNVSSCMGTIVIFLVKILCCVCGFGITNVFCSQLPCRKFRTHSRWSFLPLHKLAVIARRKNEWISVFVLSVAWIQFPAEAEYFKEFPLGWSHSANTSWASVRKWLTLCHWWCKPASPKLDQKVKDWRQERHHVEKNNAKLIWSFRTGDPA